jgi:predicted aldo/keto reductase-like oxidoreductase
MQYRTDKKSGNKLSIIGFGCMRFPKNLTQIDMNRTEQLIIKAVQDGINFFDTAYIYGGSEEVLGRILAKNKLRDKVFLSTKLPLAKCKAYTDFDSLFREQLEKLQTDYIDYYLIHNICDTHSWERLCALNIKKWIKEKKESGQIKNIGFSFHGIHNEFLELLNIYDWDFCLIQYNYLNINYQAGKAGLKKATEKGLTVFIMEPLLGGKLATGLPQKAAELFKSANSSLSPAAWAFRWLWNQPEVTVVLSGMNEISQLEDNVETAKNAVPNMLTTTEEDTFESAIKIIEASYKIPCTGCNYCMPCPHNVNIPGCFTAYNTYYTVGMISGFQHYVLSTGLLNPKKHYASSNCTECRACEKKCPQHIPIVQSLKKIRKKMEPFWLKTAITIYFKLRI